MLSSIWRRGSPFRTDERGVSAVIFALALPVAIGAAAFAITYEKRNSQAVAAQTVIDGAALAASKAYQTGGGGDAAAKTIAGNYLSAGASAVPDIVARSTVTTNAANKTVSISYNSSTPLQLGSVLLGPGLPVHAVASANMTGGRQLTPVCILITDYDAGHTLKTKQSSKLDIDHCMVQVNTNDWDAVQADDNSYIHINTSDEAGNWNCYVGDIHFGDVTPAKQPSCTLLPDPYADVDLPPAADTCTDSSNYAITNSSRTFSPGTYCGNITISGSSNVTFNPGIYYFAGGSLSILGSSNMTANGVVFVFTNKALAAPMQFEADADTVAPKAGGTRTPPKAQKKPPAGPDGQISINTTGRIVMTPYAGSEFPLLRGFLMFQDQAMFNDSTCACGQKIVITKANMTTSGLMYLADDVLDLEGATWSHKGSLVADMFLPQNNSVVHFYGDPLSPLKKGTEPMPALSN